LKLQFVNFGALNNLGFTLEEMQQMTPLDIKPELSAEDFQQLVNPLRNGKKKIQTFETVHKRADGTLYPVEVRLQLFENEQVFLAVIQDITERKRAERRCGRARRDSGISSRHLPWESR
jgi:PAS domain S-box-containing protein